MNKEKALRLTEEIQHVICAGNYRYGEVLGALAFLIREYKSKGRKYLDSSIAKQVMQCNRSEGRE